jgi:hypothetical protein
MKVIKLTEEQYELLRAALEASPAMENAGDPSDPAHGLWRACASAEDEA